MSEGDNLHHVISILTPTLVGLSFPRLRQFDVSVRCRLDHDGDHDDNHRDSPASGGDSSPEEFTGRLLGFSFLFQPSECDQALSALRQPVSGRVDQH